MHMSPQSYKNFYWFVREKRKKMRYKIIGSKLRLGCAIEACDENTVLRLTVFISSFSLLFQYVAGV